MYKSAAKSIDNFLNRNYFFDESSALHRLQSSNFEGLIISELESICTNVLLHRTLVAPAGIILSSMHFLSSTFPHRSPFCFYCVMEHLTVFCLQHHIDSLPVVGH